MWKHTTIILLYKPGKSKNKTGRYRPITLLPGLRKVLERVIQRRLLLVIEEKFIIPGFQLELRRNAPQHSSYSEYPNISPRTTVIKLDIKEALDMTASYIKSDYSGFQVHSWTSFNTTSATEHFSVTLKKTSPLSMQRKQVLPRALCWGHYYSTSTLPTYSNQKHAT
ncbi:hypothetical protein Trydic_g17991 [Trypoxylus dichotomus]